MHLSVIKGMIKRRLLVNFRAEPNVVRRILPAPFRPRLHAGYAIVGICLIRLEQIRPAGVPGVLGTSSENSAHRIAVEWKDASGTPKTGVFIPRRDTNSWLNRLAGGRLFPGEHHPARFTVVDTFAHIELVMQAVDGSESLIVVGDAAQGLPESSCFGSLQAASAFFNDRGLGYSVRQRRKGFDALRLHTEDWSVEPLAVREAYSSYFADRNRFPEGSIEFDHALVMRDLAHEWHRAEELYSVAEAA